MPVPQSPPHLRSVDPVAVYAQPAYGAPTVRQHVIPAQFERGHVVVDTTTLNGVPVVTIDRPHGEPLAFDRHETLSLARALLSRLAHLGFPDEPAATTPTETDPAPSIIRLMSCPCGTVLRLYQGATPEEHDEFDEDVREHDDCPAGVAA
jgi:hypothetical protein